MKITLSVLLIFLPGLGFAQQAGMKPLSFYAEKNNVQILAQRFEYALIDEDKLRIGDIMIDSTKLKMGRQPNTKDFRMFFNWPAALVSEGRLSILNNNGKAIWSQDFTPAQIRIGKPKNAPEDEEGIRGDIAQFLSGPLPASIVEDMKFLPFLRFCVSRITPETKVYLCSKDVFLTSIEGPTPRLGFRDRSANRKEAIVEIGGSTVTNQGLIYLNDAKDDLVLRAQTEVGAMIEIITRKREIDFKDVVISEDGKQLLVTAMGAEPARKDGVKMLGEDHYQITLSRQRPFYFVLGEGGIPMRQEFFVKADPPTEDLRPYVKQSSPTKTYRTNVALRGTKAANGTVTADEPSGELRDAGGNDFIWTLKNLETGKNRRSLLIDSGKGQFVASYDIEGGRPNIIDLDAIYAANKGVAWGRLAYQRHMEDFLWIKTSATEFRWSLTAEYFKQLNIKDETPEVDLMTVGLNWRSTPGFPFEKATANIGFLMGPAKVNKESSMAMGLEFGYQSPTNKSWERWAHWWDTKARLWSSSGTETKLNTSYQLEARAYKKMGTNSYWRYGTGLSQFKTTTELPKEGPQLDLNLGLGRHF